MNNLMLTRRQFTRTALALPLVLPAWAQKPRRVPHFASRFGGVRIGAQTYCYRSLRDTACIEYEYAGKGTAVEEVQKCLGYAKRALTA